MAKKTRVKTLGGFYVAWTGKYNPWNANRPSSINRNACLQRFVSRPDGKYVFHCYSDSIWRKGAIFAMNLEYFLKTGEFSPGKMERYLYSLSIDDLIIQMGSENDFLFQELSTELLENFKHVNDLQSAEMENASDAILPFQDHPNFKKYFPGLIK